MNAEILGRPRVNIAIRLLSPFSAFLEQGNIHFEITVSRLLVLGLVALLALLNTYLVSRRKPRF